MPETAHAHSHASHTAPSSGRVFAIATGLNLAFVAFEFFGGLFANSIALLADAGHNLGDVLGLVAAWIAILLARRLPTARYTYGLHSATILASLVNASLLWLTTGAILVEGLRRLVFPEAVGAEAVGVIALIGVVLNGATALLFVAHRKGDINLRSVFVHMAGDTAISAGVVLSAVLVGFTGWERVDPVVSILIAIAIGWSTWGLFRESLGMMLDAVPTKIHPEDVRTYLLALPGVTAIHDLHIWPMSTSETALTCHLVMPEAMIDPEFLSRVALDLEERFGIGHPTLQVEHDGKIVCALAPDHVI